MRELVLIALFAVLPIVTMSCQVQGSCETTPSFVEYCATGDASCQGHIINATTWESGPEDGTFINWGAEQLYHLNFRDAKTGQVLSGKLVDVSCFVSAVPQANAPGNNFIRGADQLCEGGAFDPAGNMFLRNDTCGSYFVRIVVTVAQDTSADAGTE